MPNETTPDFEALKARMKATWMAGDFGLVAKYAEHEALPRKLLQRYRRTSSGRSVVIWRIPSDNTTKRPTAPQASKPSTWKS